MRWNDGSDGRPLSSHVDVEEDKLNVELNFLREEVYQGDVELACREITALDSIFRSGLR